METYLNQANADELLRVKQAVSEESYPLSAIEESGFTSRNINRWVKGNYLLNPPRSKSWAKFTFLDYVWIKVLLCMSDLGVSKDSNSKRAAAEKGNMQKIIQCLVAANPLAVADEIDNQPSRIANSTLLHVVVDSLVSRGRYHLRIVKEGVCQLLRDGEVVATSDPMRTADSDSFVQISFSDIFIDFVTKQIMAGHGKDLMWKGFLTNPEGTLVENLKYPGLVEKLTVEVNEEESKVFLVAEGVTEEVARYLAKRIIRGDYHKMIYEVAGELRSFVIGSEETDFDL